MVPADSIEEKYFSSYWRFQFTNDRPKSTTNKWKEHSHSCTCSYSM